MRSLKSSDWSVKVYDIFIAFHIYRLNISQSVQKKTKNIFQEREM